MVFSRSLHSLLFFVLLSTGFFVRGFPATSWAQDRDLDGIPDANEAGIGGNPLRKDIFVECDYMQIDFNADGDGLDRGEHSHRMSTTTVQRLVQTFANAPVANPGLGCQGGPKNGLTCSSPADCGNFPCSLTGITLWIEQNQALPDQRFLDFTNRKGGRNFFDIKAANFNFAARAPYYRYCILAHDASEEMGSTSGQAEILGNDFIVSLGAWPSATGRPEGTANEQLGTFLHELGHTLGLDHGGGSLLPADARIENYKPNYLSVMNYFFQVSGIRSIGPVPTPRFDFSRVQLPTLNEAALNENDGIKNILDMTRFFCPQSFVVRPGGSGAIDWNCSGGAPTVNVVANLNGDRTAKNLPIHNTLEGHNDWANIRLPFTTSPVYDAGAGVGLAQHQGYLGAYKPVSMSAIHGIDREPEATLPGGRCQKFFTIDQLSTGGVTTFSTREIRQPDANGNGIGDVCE
jgi:hypothetical protein